MKKNSPALILIVDDNAANRETLVELLAVPDYQLVEAHDGPRALELAAEVPPDLVLLDVMMPGMDGYEVCRRLRADPQLSELPVIMITALDDRASRLAGLEAGADDFITKPFDSGELRARVRTITRLNRYRRLTESREALSASEARLRQLAEHSDEVFWFATPKPERLIFISPAVEKIWGRSVSEFYADARAWEKAIHPDDHGRVHAAYEGMLAGRAVGFSEEFRVLRPDGATRWVLNGGTAVQDDNGNLVGLGGVARDITERKEAEQNMLRAQRVENMGMLAAGIAHDFNNALAPILMAAPMLQATESDPGRQRMLGTIEKCAARGAALVRQLLSFTRGSGGGMRSVAVLPVLQEVIDLAASSFPKSINFVARLPADLRPIQGNPTQIHQVILNFCVNARDAMPQGGELGLSAMNCSLDVIAAAAVADARPGTFVAIEVRDTGTGIPPDVLERIWEPFFSTKGEGKGTGLGLATVRGIVHEHGGFVNVKTRVGSGTTFTVYLPTAEEATSRKSEPDFPPSQRGHGELILVVEDDQPVREITERILTSHGYRVITAGDGAEAIAVFVSRATEVRLLLTDLGMPMLDGRTLAAALHRLQSNLPVISMSGASSRASEAQKTYADAFLAKPFKPEALLALVRRVLDDSQSTSTPSPSCPAS